MRIPAKAYRLALLFLILGSAVALYVWYNPDRNLIDEEYLSTDPYRSLQAEMSESGEALVDEQALVQTLVRQSLKSFPVTRVAEPVRLDTSYIYRRMKPSHRLGMEDESAKLPQAYEQFRFYQMQNYVAAGDTLVLLLLEHPGMYRELELLMASASGPVPGITDWSIIARYRSNLEEMMFNTIEIYPDGAVNVNVQRHIRYPIEQENSYTGQFYLDSLGTIQSHSPEAD